MRSEKIKSVAARSSAAIITVLAISMGSCKPLPKGSGEEMPKLKTNQRSLSGLTPDRNQEPTPLFGDKTLDSLGLNFPGNLYALFTQRELTWLKQDLKKFFDIEIPSSSGTFVTRKGETKGLHDAPKQTLVTFFMPPDELEAFKEHVRERTQANTGFGRRWNHYSERILTRVPERIIGFEFPVGTLYVRCTGSATPSGERRDDAVYWKFHPRKGYVRYQYLDHDDWE